MPSMTQGNARVFFETWGTGNRWVTLVNGHTRDHTDFRRFASFLVAKGWRVMSLDNRGCGQTKNQGPFCLDDMVDDIHAIWDSEGIKSTHLLGISMGGQIAMRAAIRHPQKIKSLVLVSTTGQSRFLKSTGSWQENLDEIEKKLKFYFAKQFVERNKLLINAMAKQIHKRMIAGSFLEDASLQVKAMKDVNTLVGDYLGQIIKPTLIIHGDQDEVIPFAAAEYLDENLENSQLVKLEGVGHLILAEAAKLFYEKSEDFLQSVAD